MAVPLPKALVRLALGEELQANRVVGHLKHELRRRLVGLAKLLPVDPVGGADLAQLGQQAVGQFGDRGLLHFRPVPEHFLRRGVPQEENLAPDQRQRRFPSEKAGLRHGATLPTRQDDFMGEKQVGLLLVQMRVHLDDAPQKINRFAFSLKLDPRGFSPLHQPLEQVSAVQRDQLRLGVVVVPNPGRPADE